MHDRVIIFECHETQRLAAVLLCADGSGRELAFCSMDGKTAFVNAISNAAAGARLVFLGVHRQVENAHWNPTNQN